MPGLVHPNVFKFERQFVQMFRNDINNKKKFVTKFKIMDNTGQLCIQSSTHSSRDRAAVYMQGTEFTLARLNVIITINVYYIQC